MSLIPKTCHLHNQTHCGDCRLHALCLPLSLQMDDVGKLDDIVQQGPPSAKGDVVYRAGEAFHAIYAVRSGAVKTLSHSAEGDEQVTGFTCRVKLSVLDGIATGQHTTPPSRWKPAQFVRFRSIDWKSSVFNCRIYSGVFTNYEPRTGQ